MTHHGSAARELRIFLEESFSAPQLEQFLIEHDLQAVTNALNTGGGLTRYFFDAVMELGRRGHLNDAFFTALAKERPEKETRVMALKQAVLEPSRGDDQTLLDPMQVEELLDTAQEAGLLGYETQMKLVEKASPGLLDGLRLPPRMSDLLRATVERLNRLPGEGREAPLARWLALAIAVAERRGYAGPYRRALEVICGAEFRSAEDLDVDARLVSRNRAVPASFLTTDFLARGLQAAASACRMKVLQYRDGRPEQFKDKEPVFHLGSGWLITPSLLVTAWHNLAGGYRGGKPEMTDVRLQVAHALYEFDYEHGVSNSVAIRGGRLLAWNEGADAALLRLAGETERGGLRVRGNSTRPLDPEERVSMIHHGLAERKQLGLRGRLYTPEVVQAATPIPDHLRIAERLIYDLPSAPGSSGAPLFDDGWNLVGHHVGSLTLPADKRVPARLCFGLRLDALHRFLAGDGADTDDEVLLREALAEIKPRLLDE